MRKENNFNNSQRFLNYIKCHKDFNTLKLYTLKALLSKNRFCFAFFKFNIPNQKSDKNNTIRIIFIKFIIKINIIKININITHFIIIKYSITRIFIKIEYIFIRIQSRKGKKVFYSFYL